MYILFLYSLAPSSFAAFMYTLLFLANLLRDFSTPDVGGAPFCAFFYFARQGRVGGSGLTWF
jgi:hypothetical protein